MWARKKTVHLICQTQEPLLSWSGALISAGYHVTSQPLDLEKVPNDSRCNFGTVRSLGSGHQVQLWMHESNFGIEICVECPRNSRLGQIVARQLLSLGIRFRTADDACSRTCLAMFQAALTEDVFDVIKEHCSQLLPDNSSNVSKNAVDWICSEKPDLIMIPKSKIAEARSMVAAFFGGTEAFGQYIAIVHSNCDWSSWQEGKVHELLALDMKKCGAEELTIL